MVASIFCVLCWAATAMADDARHTDPAVPPSDADSKAAAAGGIYTLSPVVSPAGGGTSANGTRAAAATIGQFDTGEARGGAYSFRAGFWQAPASSLFSNGFE